MFYLVYNVFSIFLLLPVILYHLYRSLSRGRKAAFGERFGYLPEKVAQAIALRPVIWLHAVSVGEAMAARPLLKALRARHPDHAVVISCTTETGRAVAEGFQDKDVCIYFPFDFLPAVRKTLEQIKPRVIIIMETEIWPNFTREAARRKLPVILANGRISDRSYGRYLKFSWFFRHALEHFSALCMQTETDRERITAIGAPAERTVTAGNIKYDIPGREVTQEEKNSLRGDYGIPAELKVIAAASTHPGEEELILGAYLELSAIADDLFLVLVPRHPERADAVASLLDQAGVAYRRRTALDAIATERFRGGGVLLVDTIGEMMRIYALSDIAFVGGSLVPTGGHNLLEPASLGVATVFGPHMTNFREIAALVLQCRAGLQVTTPADLTGVCRTLLAEPGQRHAMGRNGLRMIQENGGATERHLHVVARHLG